MYTFLQHVNGKVRRIPNAGALPLPQRRTSVKPVLVGGGLAGSGSTSISMLI